MSICSSEVNIIGSSFKTSSQLPLSGGNSMRSKPIEVNLGLTLLIKPKKNPLLGAGQ